MKITSEDVKHLAKLSDLELSDEETEAMREELEGVIGYVSQLNELDTEGVEPTYQVFEMENIWRPDEILEQEAKREDLLKLTTEEKENQIKVPKVL